MLFCKEQSLNNMHSPAVLTVWSAVLLNHTVLQARSLGLDLQYH
jgi:hypothetical protein